MTGNPIMYEAARVAGVPYLTTAVPVVDWGEPDDTEWLRARRHGIGASEIASVCGVPGAFSSPYALYWAKRLEWETGRTFGMRVGQVLEAPIAQLFGEDHPELTIVKPSARLFGSVEHRWMLASPDYIAVATCDACGGTGRVECEDPLCLSADHGGPCSECDGHTAWIEPVECKSDEGKSWGDEPPIKHVMQVWQQMMVLGAPRGHLVRLSGKRLTAYTVEPNPDAWAVMVKSGEWFMGLIRNDTPPEVDGHDATEDALRRLYPAPAEPDAADETTTVRQMLLAEFRAAHEDRATAEARFAEARNRVREAMGKARFGVDLDGERYIERRQYKRAGFVMPPTVVDEIRKAW